jgi:hypothetical protein
MELFSYRVYEMADLVATTIENDRGEFGLFDEQDWNWPGVKGCLNRFSKTSLLAHCCFAIIRIYHLRAYRKDPEAFDGDHIQLTEEALRRYAIPFVSFRDFMISRFPPSGAPHGEGAPGAGVGLENVRRRLAICYGPASDLRIDIRPETAVVELYIPLAPAQVG